MQALGRIHRPDVLHAQGPPDGDCVPIVQPAVHHNCNRVHGQHCKGEAACCMAQAPKPYALKAPKP
eukprot:124850-Chlamydomonas_euryale.AAC.2